MAEFMAAYPDIRPDLDFSDRLVDVIEEGFDAVLRVGEPSDSRMNARRLVFPRRVVASPGYLQRCGVPRTPAGLMQHTLLHYRFPTTGKLEPWPIHWPDDETPQELPVHMVANTIEARVALALRDIGLAFVPVHSVRDALPTAARSRCWTNTCIPAAPSICCGRRADTYCRSCGCSSTSSATAWVPCRRSTPCVDASRGERKPSIGSALQNRPTIGSAGPCPAAAHLTIQPLPLYWPLIPPRGSRPMRH